MGLAITSVDCNAHDADIYNISEEEVSQWLYTPLDTIFATIFIPSSLCLGVITNFTFIFIIFRGTTMKTTGTKTTNIYLVNLAIGDFLYLCLFAVFEIWKFTVTPVAFDFPIQIPAALTSFWFLANTGYYASIALVTMVSLERYLALCHPIKHLKIRSRQRTYRLVAICWLVGLIFAGVLVPYYAFLSVLCLQWPDNVAYLEFPSKVVYYSVNPHSWSYYIPLLQGIPWFTAMVLNMYVYVQMIRALNKRRHSCYSGTDKHQKALHVRNQVAKMLIVNGTVFFTCQTPFNVISFWWWISLVADVPGLALGSADNWIINIPILINNVVNPLIYGAMSTQYRQALIRAFQFRTKHRKGRSMSSCESSTAKKSKSTIKISVVESTSNETRL